MGSMGSGQLRQGLVISLDLADLDLTSLSRNCRDFVLFFFKDILTMVIFI